MSLRQYIVAAVLAGASLVSAQNLQPAPQSPIRGTETVRGCFSSFGELELLYDDPDIFNSRGECNTRCRGDNKNVAATSLNACYCGDKYPPSGAKVADTRCSEPCPGFDQEACGGLNTFSVYNTGVRVTVDESEDVQSSSTSNSPTSTRASTSTSTTMTSTAPTQSTGAPVETASETPEAEGSSNTVGIAVGVVCGILAVGAACGAAYFYMRRRRNEEIEEEHRRNAAVNAFITGGKPPGSSGGLSMSDSRLDPVMVNRRMSDGSIADNQDYSRRILRVTNA